MDGASLSPLLRGEPRWDRDAIFWHFPGYLDGPVPHGRDPVFRTRPVTVMRAENWKLHLYHEEWQLDGGRDNLETNNAVELYNLAKDPGERNNLALANPARRDELLTTLLGWIARTGALLPSDPNPACQKQAAIVVDRSAIQRPRSVHGQRCCEGRRWFAERTTTFDTRRATQGIDN